MVFTRKIEADHGTPGLDWEPIKDGAGIKARLYQSFPSRLNRWRWPLGLCLFYSLTHVDPTGSNPFPSFFEASFRAFLIVYPVFLFWPVWPFVKFMRMDGENLTVGLNRYNLRDVTGFSTRRYNYGPGKNHEIITFGYGRKTIKLKVPNPPGHAFRIAEFLNWSRKGLLERGTLASDQAVPQPEEDRAAAF